MAWAAARGRAWTEDDSRACMGRNSREWSEVMRERLGRRRSARRRSRARSSSALVARYAAAARPGRAGRPGGRRVDRGPRARRDRLVGASGGHPGGARRGRAAPTCSGSSSRPTTCAAGKPAPGRLPRGRPPPRGRAGPLPRRRGLQQRRPGRAGGRDARRPGPQRQRAAGPGRRRGGRRRRRAASPTFRWPSWAAPRERRRATPRTGARPSGPRRADPLLAVTTGSCGSPSASTSACAWRAASAFRPGPSMLCFNHQSWADPVHPHRGAPGAPRHHVLRAQGGGHAGRQRRTASSRGRSAASRSARTRAA